MKITINWPWEKKVLPTPQGIPRGVYIGTPHAIVSLTTAAIQPPPNQPKRENKTMCTNATKTAADLLAAEKSSLTNLLTVAGVANTPAAQVIMTEYSNVETALQSWTGGSPAQEILQILGDIQTGIEALRIPATYLTFVNIAIAGIEAVIGVITANSPAPAPSSSVAVVPEEHQALHAADAIATTTAKVQALVPAFKRSKWHSAASQYRKTWNDAVYEGAFPETLVVA